MPCLLAGRSGGDEFKINWPEELSRGTLSKPRAPRRCRGDSAGAPHTRLDAQVPAMSGAGGPADDNYDRTVKIANVFLPYPWPACARCPPGPWA